MSRAALLWARLGLRCAPVVRLAVRVSVAIAVLALASCTQAASSDAELADKIAAGLATACPEAAADDELARNECSAALTDFGLLRDTMANPFLWGGQTAEGLWELDDHVTMFNPRVWRRLYLSLYSFDKEHRVEQLTDGRTLLHLNAHFRNGLDMGSYPYPFWHKPSKWQSYQLAQEVVLYVKDKKLIGGQRSFAEQADKPFVAHQWGGQWQWSKGSELMPFAALYGYFFSKDNPNVAPLEAAYRNLEFKLRDQNCLVCHNPENGASMAKLELLNYPNQALSGRHRIVTQLEGNLMPSQDVPRGYTEGIADESKRKELLELAKTFAAAGDEAMAWEGEK
jgi:hypothetical protein